MAETGAFVRIERIASGLSQRISGLRGDTSAFIDTLAAVEPRVAQTVRAMEAYQDKVRAGKALEPTEVANFQALAQGLRDRAIPRLQERAAPGPDGAGPEQEAAGIVAQQLTQYVNSVSPIAAQPAAQPEAQPAAQPEAQPAVQPEAQPAAQPEAQPAVQPEAQAAAQPEAQPGAPKAVPVPGRPEWYTDQGSQAVEMDEPAESRTSEAVERRDEAIKSLAEAQNMAALSDSQLRGEWSRSIADLNAYNKEIERLEKRIEALTRKKREGAKVDDELAGAFAEMRDMQRQHYESWQYNEALRYTAEDRGMRPGGPRGDKLRHDQDSPFGGGGGGNGRRIFGAFAGGMGIGGGNGMGALLGFATGVLSLPMALAAIAGGGIGYAWQRSTEASKTRATMYGETIPTRQMTGVDSREQIQSAAELSRASLIFRDRDIRQAQSTLGRETGGIGSIEDLTLLAGYTGRQVPELAGMYAQLARAGRTVSDDDLAMRTYTAFRKSRAYQGTEQPGLFLGDFERASLQATQVAGAQSPFSRPDVPGIQQQLSLMMALPTPGVDPGNGPAIIDIAQKRLAATHQMYQGMGSGGDAMSDLAYLGVTRLRGDTNLVNRLRDAQGIDINTPVGVLEAIQRSAELSTDFPELSRAVAGAMKEFIPDENLRAVAMLGKAGGNAQTARFLAGEGLRFPFQPLEVANRNRDDGQGVELSRAAAEEDQQRRQNRPDAQAVFVEDVVPLLNETRNAMSSLADIGQEFREIRNTVDTWLPRMSDAIVDAFENAWNEEVIRQQNPAMSRFLPPETL